MNAPESRAASSALTTAGDPPAYEVATMRTPGNTALILDPQYMANMMSVAQAMATAKVTVPQHLQGKPGDCLAVVMQAAQWGMNPFAVAQKTHVVNGTLGYEAQLVHAVLQATGAIEGTFSYEYKGDANTMQCRVGAVCKGDKDLTWGEWLSVSSVTTKNSPLWKTNPKQQMGYLQVKNWARAFKPGAILGVYTTDELAENPPKNMGPAEMVLPTAPPELLTKAQTAADGGRETFGKFWQDCLPPERLLLAAETADLKRRTQEADRRRTLDNGAQAEASQGLPADTLQTHPVDDKQQHPAEGQASDTGEAVTFAKLADRIAKASNEDAVLVVQDWIREIPDEGQRKELNDKAEARIAELGGAK